MQSKQTLLTSDNLHLTLILATCSVNMSWMIWPMTSGSKTVRPSCLSTVMKSTVPPLCAASCSGVASMSGSWNVSTSAGDTKMPSTLPTAAFMRARSKTHEPPFMLHKGRSDLCVTCGFVALGGLCHDNIGWHRSRGASSNDQTDENQRVHGCMEFEE